MRYYLNYAYNGKTWEFDNYKELLKYLKKYYGDLRLKEFSKQYRHNENDGIYKEGYWTEKRFIKGYDLKGWPIYGYVRDRWIEPSFEPNNLQATDSYGRILNAKDLWKDMQVVSPEEERRRRYWYGGIGYARWQKGRDWQKYRGDHGFLTGELRDTVYHELEQKEVLEEYGTTFKIRAKRRNELPEFWWQWDTHKPDCRITKGWKRTRKKKQWM